MEDVFSRDTFQNVKSVVDLKIFFNVPYLKKLILNSPYNHKKILDKMQFSSLQFVHG